MGVKVSFFKVSFFLYGVLCTNATRTKRSWTVTLAGVSKVEPFDRYCVIADLDLGFLDQLEADPRVVSVNDVAEVFDLVTKVENLSAHRRADEIPQGEDWDAFSAATATK